MAERGKSIAVVAPARNITPDVAARVEALARALYGARAPTLFFHPQCYLSSGHFAGPDAARADAFVEVANDPAFDAVWFARGGYGACRLAPDLIDRLGPASRDKAYLGYSDIGFLLARLYGAGIGVSAHGPMPMDITRADGEAAVARALAWLAEGAPASLEASARPSAPAIAFNVAVLAAMAGTPDAPDLAGHVVMLEEVGEHLYAFDRAMFSILTSEALRGAAGVMLGRVSEVPENDPPFERTPEEITRFWCERAGVPYLGRADIGHDGANRVVVFGS